MGLIITWIISVISIVRSIVSALHSHRYPVEPGILGKIIQFLAVTIIVVIRIFLISLTLLNAVYLHAFLHCFNITIAYLYCKFSNEHISHLYDHVPLIMIIPTFYSTSNIRNDRRHENEEAQTYLKLIREKFVAPIILYLMTFGVYCSIGAVLRETTFPYNIRPKDNDDVENDIPIFSKDDFQNYVINIPYLTFFATYLVAIALHLLFSLIYYRIGHPWKVILWGDKRPKNNNKENVQDHEEMPLN